MKIDNVQLDLEQNVQNAEVIKTMILNTLLKDRVISEEIHTKYNTQHAVILIKESWYKSLFSKSENWVYKFVSIFK
jgi:hypothetical protein